MRKGALKQRTQRAIFLLLMLACILGIFFARLVQLQVVQFSVWSSRSKNNHVSKRILEMRRGSITDRQGSELAISMETYSVYIYTKELKSLSETAEIVSTLLPLSKEDIIDKVQGKNGYFCIYKHLPPGLATKLRKLNLSGVNLEKTYKRYYPQGRLAANLIGFTGTDKRGLEGIELKLNKTLKGYPGLAVKENISLNDDMASKLRVVRPPMGGSNVKLTIDTFIQHTMEVEIAKLVKEYKPIDASAIAMDPHTGEILGMACYPSYNLNEFSKSKPAQRRNRPVVDIFEPGSCMKIFAMAAAVKTGKVDHGTRFYCRGYGELDGRKVRCHGAHGLVDPAEAIAQSCNAAMVQISQMVKPDQLYSIYKKAGFGSPTGLEVPAESIGILRPPSQWSGFSEISLCIGQEMAATNIQLVAAYSAIANGGELLKPLVVKRIISPDGDIRQDFQKSVVRRIVTPELAKWLRQMLRGGVDHGTGRLAKLKDYTVGGKTSTAQKPDGKGGYSRDNVFVSFIGMSPAINPKVVLIVEANEPKGDDKALFGGKVTAPTFARIMDRILKYMKVPPDKMSADEAFSRNTLEDNDDMSLHSVKNSIDKTTKSIQKKKTVQVGAQYIPDFTGMSLKSVILSLKERGLKGKLKGSGVAVNQSPKPGSKIPLSKIITIEFSTDT